MPEKLLEQLDEAQFLVKSAASTGQSKEARLARVCAGLSSRLQEYKAENAQLEELLMRERGRSSSYEASIKQLEQDLLLAQMEMSKVESSMGDALTAKNAEIEKLVGSIDAFKKQASTAEGKLVSLQANMDALMRGRELSEIRVIQALREELAAAERRAEEERIAHNATKMAAVEREVELEQSCGGLKCTCKNADESISKAMDLEHKVALLEVECGSLNQELQDMEARMRRGLKKSSKEANQILQVNKASVFFSI
ncbi:golgin-84-like [Wolffia australiana]